MYTSARVTAKGQVTIPIAVRTALAIEPGDDLVFRVEGHRAVVARTPDFLDLAGVVSTPPSGHPEPSPRHGAWTEIIRRAEARRPS